MKGKIWHLNEGTGQCEYDSVTEIVTGLNWGTLEDRRKVIRLGIMHKINRGFEGWIVSHSESPFMVHNYRCIKYK
jgi:hypothetical protein